VGACAFAAVRGARLAWSRRRSRIRCGGEAPGAPTQIYGISEGVFRNLPAALVAESDAKHILLGFVFVFFSFRRRISPAVYDIGCYKFFFQQRALYKVFGESATQKKGFGESGYFVKKNHVFLFFFGKYVFLFL
jgi:hypothetical protein